MIFIMHSIYVLALEQGKYYIGKSRHVGRRYQEHVNGMGSAWTRLYKPISIHTILPSASPFDEDKCTKEYMSVHGIHNVRGGAYVTVHLTPCQIKGITKEIWSATDRCMRCGQYGHFATKCTTDEEN
jgi:predicted GIY-YIG superfamily endonuclease